MNKRTFQIRSAELLRDVKQHKYSRELLNIMTQQLLDDDVIIDTKY